MSSDGIRAHTSADSRGQWLILTDELSIADAQRSGRWLKAQPPGVVEVEQ